MKTTEQRISELKQSLNAEFENKVRDILAEEKAPKFEVGDWVVCLGGAGSFSLPMRDGVPVRVYEISEYGGLNLQDITGKNECNGSNPKNFRPATKEEIQSALIKEAERRGFKADVKFVPLDPHRYRVELGGTCFKYDPITDGLYASGHCLEFSDALYLKGQWATPIKEDEVIIGGHPVEFRSHEIKVGCTTVSNNIIEKIYNRQFKKP